MQKPVHKQPRPVAVCVRCGRVHPVAAETTVICLRTDEKGVVCGGRISWRANPRDWVECEACNGTGNQDGSICPTCAGDGWLLRKQ